MSVPSAEMLRAFLSAPSPDAWLSSELAKVLSEGLSDSETNALIEQVRNQAKIEADEFLASMVSPHEVVATVVVFARPGEDESGATGGVFTSTPSATALLEMAANECEALDEVVISHRYASGEEITLSRTWPFGLSGAVDLLTPGSAPLAQESEDGLNLDLASCTQED